MSDHRVERVLSLMFLAIVVSGIFGGPWAAWAKFGPYSSPWTYWVPMLILWYVWRRDRLRELGGRACDAMMSARDPIGYLRRQMLSAPPSAVGRWREGK